MKQGFWEEAHGLYPNNGIWFLPNQQRQCPRKDQEYRELKFAGGPVAYANGLIPDGDEIFRADGFSACAATHVTDRRVFALLATFDWLQHDWLAYTPHANSILDHGNGIYSA